MAQAWSFSALGAFETCPWRYFLTKIEKSIKEPETEATRWGKEVHKHFELRVVDAKPLPNILANWNPTLDKIMAGPGIKSAERQYCLNEHLKPTSWFAKDAWCRAVIDLEILNGEKGAALDWKTGKKKPGSDQLELFAAVMFHHHEELQECNTGFFWMQEKQPFDTSAYHRNQLSDIWGNWMPRVQRLQDAVDKQRWPKRPSGLCRAWCPVGRAKCEHCGKP